MQSIHHTDFSTLFDLWDLRGLQSAVVKIYCNFAESISFLEDMQDDVLESIWSEKDR